MVISSGEFADPVSLDAEHLFRDHPKSVRHHAEISVRFAPKQVFALLRNECSTWSEIRRWLLDLPILSSGRPGTSFYPRNYYRVKNILRWGISDPQIRAYHGGEKNQGSLTVIELAFSPAFDRMKL